jgi:hypothetical protein
MTTGVPFFGVAHKQTIVGSSVLGRYFYTNSGGGFVNYFYGNNLIY